MGNMHLRVTYAFALLLLLASSFARADPQAVAGIEIDYPLPFKQSPELTQRLMVQAKDNWGAPVKTLQVFAARPSWAASGGIGSLQIVKVTFEGDNPRALDAMAGSLDTRMTGPGGGIVFWHTVTPTMVGDREARQFSFERQQEGWRFGGEALLVGDPASGTAWMIQMLFGREPELANLGPDRILVKKILSSVKVMAP